MRLDVVNPCDMIQRRSIVFALICHVRRIARVDIRTHYCDLLFVQILPSTLKSPWLSEALTDRVVNSINAQ